MVWDDMTFWRLWADAHEKEPRENFLQINRVYRVLKDCKLGGLTITYTVGLSPQTLLPVTLAEGQKLIYWQSGTNSGDFNRDTTGECFGWDIFVKYPPEGHESWEKGLPPEDQLVKIYTWDWIYDKEWREILAQENIEAGINLPPGERSRYDYPYEEPYEEI